MADRDEFEPFVRAHLDGLYGYARFLAGNEHDAWDLVQEALTRMGVRWSRIDTEGNPVGYARTAIARLAVDRHRAGTRERPTEPVPEPAVAEIAGDAVEPWLADALRSLPLRQRTALVLRFVDDLDYAGIADVMGGSVSTAKSQVSRGLARLRELAPAGSPLATEGDEHV